MTSGLPRLTIGSTARINPLRKRGLRSNGTKFGTAGSSCRFLPIPCPTNCFTIVNPWCSTQDCIAPQISPSLPPFLAPSMPLKRGLPCYFHQMIDFRSHLPNRERYGLITIVSSHFRTYVDTYQVSLLKLPGTRYTVNDLFVYGNTDGGRITMVSLEGRFRLRCLARPLLQFYPVRRYELQGLLRSFRARCASPTTLQLACMCSISRSVLRAIKFRSAYTNMIK